MLLNRVLITTTAEIIQLYVIGCCLLLKSFSVFFFFFNVWPPFNSFSTRKEAEKVVFT